MTQHRVIPFYLALAGTCMGVAGCYQGIEPFASGAAFEADADAIVEDEAFRMVEVRDDGFTARLVQQGEVITVKSRTTQMVTTVTVSGLEEYAAWTVDFAAGEGTGQVAGVPIEDDDPERWRPIATGHAGEVIRLVSVGASELASDSFADGQEEAPPAPGTDAMLDGLRLLTTMTGFVEARVPDQLVAPQAQPDVSVDALADQVDPAAGPDYICLPEWKCAISVGLGCGGLATKTGPTWLTAAGCAWTLLDGCGFLCPTSNYLEYWDGNCLRSASAWANHSNTIYCVGGGCSTCY